MELEFRVHVRRLSASPLLIGLCRDFSRRRPYHRQIPLYSLAEHRGQCNRQDALSKGHLGAEGEPGIATGCCRWDKAGGSSFRRHQKKLDSPDRASPAPPSALTMHFHLPHDCHRIESVRLLQMDPEGHLLTEISHIVLRAKTDIVDDITGVGHNQAEACSSSIHL